MLVSADPQFADAAVYDAADGPGIIILCIGLDRLDESLGYLSDVRASNLRLMRQANAEPSLTRWQAQRSELEVFGIEILGLKNAYLLALAESHLGDSSSGVPDFEWDALVTNLLEALALSEPAGQVWVVTAESAWAAPAVRALDAGEMRFERRHSKEMRESAGRRSPAKGTSSSSSSVRKSGGEIP